MYVCILNTVLETVMHVHMHTCPTACARARTHKTVNSYIHFTGLNHLDYLHLEDKVGYWKLIVKSVLRQGLHRFCKNLGLFSKL